MITYNMTIVNSDHCVKNVVITGENFNDAVNKVKMEYGDGWFVNNCEIVFMK